MTSRREYESVEEYLERLRDGLSMLPASEREQTYRELAQHVQAIIDEEVSTGEDRETAIRAALKKFGDPEKIGQKVGSDYWRRNINFYRAPFQPRSLVRLAGESPMGTLLAGMVLTGWLQILAMMITLVFEVSPAFWIVLGAISGVPIGVASGWNWAKGKTQNSARVLKKPWKRWTREHFGFLAIGIVIVLIVAILFVLDSHLALHSKRSLVMNLAMVIAELAIACSSQPFFSSHLKKAQSELQADE